MDPLPRARPCRLDGTKPLACDIDQRHDIPLVEQAREHLPLGCGQILAAAVLAAPMYEKQIAGRGFARRLQHGVEAQCLDATSNDLYAQYCRPAASKNARWMGQVGSPTQMAVPALGQFRRERGLSLQWFPWRTCPRTSHCRCPAGTTTRRLAASGGHSTPPTGRAASATSAPHVRHKMNYSESPRMRQYVTALTSLILAASFAATHPRSPPRTTWPS